MARTSMEQKAFGKAQSIASLSGTKTIEIIGILCLLWNQSQEIGLEIVDRKWIDSLCLREIRRKDTRNKIISQLVRYEFLEQTENDAYRIKGNAKHIENLVVYKERTKLARNAKAKKSLIDNQYQQSDSKNKDNPEFVFESDDLKHKMLTELETREVIHSDDGKALPVAENEKNTKQQEFKKTSDVRESSELISADNYYYYVQEHEKVSSSSYLNFNKKEKEEKLIEASTDFVYEQKMPDANVDNENQAKVDNASASEDSYFDDACHKFRERFEWRVGRKIDAGQNARLRYSQVIKSGVNHSQVLTMIDNYADAKFSEYPGRDGFFPIHSTFERFLGFPGDWHCKKYLTPIAIVDRSKLERNAQSKASADEAETKRLERQEKRAAAREFRLTDNLELKAKIRERIEATEKMKQKAQSERKSAGLSGTGFESAGDILNRMNLKF